MRRQTDQRGPLVFDVADVVESTTSTSSGRRRVRDSRRGDTRSMTVRIEHAPTAIVVEGSLPPGHYSRTEMRQLQQSLRARLLEDLERVVLQEMKRRRRRGEKPGA